MDRNLAFLCAAVGFGVIVFAFPDGIGAVLVATLIAAGVSLIISRSTEDVQYLQKIFIIGLLLRTTLGFFIDALELQPFFGGDAYTYDFLGYRVVEVWLGRADLGDFWTIRATNTVDPGWGMNYIIAAVYICVGRNMLAGQFFCSVIGAATAPVVYVLAQKLYHNKRVSRIAALIVAISPSFLIWSAQMLKDGLIVFLLAVIILMILKLQENYNYLSILILIISLFGVLSLRFYIFYIVVIAVAGSFLVGFNNSFSSMIRRLIVVFVLGMALVYLGVLQRIDYEYNEYGSLERVNNARKDLASRGESGFGQDMDVSTVEGATFALPVGFLYLMLAPFPWQVTNVRQLITLPDVFIWWALLPFMVKGLWFTIKTRLRTTIAIIIFTILLTLIYSLFQGNVGTAYRQRTQIQLFLFIFVAVGITLYQEKQENRKLIIGLKRKQTMARLKTS
jgi:hypothetical protein